MIREGLVRTAVGSLAMLALATTACAPPEQPGPRSAKNVLLITQAPERLRSLGYVQWGLA